VPAPSAAAGIGAVRLTVARLSHPGLILRGLRFDHDPLAARAQLRIASLQLAGQRWMDVRLDCPQARLSPDAFRCSGGRLAVGGPAFAVGLDAVLDLSARSGHFVLRGEDGLHIEARLGDDGRLQARAHALPLQALTRWLPAFRPWQAGGIFAGSLDWRAAGSRSDGRLSLRGELKEGRFASADGLQAGEALALGVSVDARERRGQWDWSGSLEWKKGASYWHPFYLEAGPTFAAAGTLQGRRLQVRDAVVDLDGVRQLAASATVDLTRRTLDSAAIALTGADLARVGPRFIAPLLAPASMDRLHFSGILSAGLRFERGVLTELDAVFEQAGFNFAGAGGERLALGPLDGHLPWRARQPTRARLSIGGGRWEKLELGPFELAAELAGSAMRLDRTRIPLLDGALVLEKLSLRREAAGWVGGGGATIEPLSMPLLTATLGLPRMAGALSASIPALRLRPGEIALDGTLVVSVFDGSLQVGGLRVLEPFGVASRLAADIAARRLDLAKLTETFSFGGMTGFIDADVLGLELAHWQPQRFDARIVSSPGDYRRRISQRAVQNLGALGGAGAMAALQRSLLGLFDTFGYRELGLRCVLRGELCEMSGIDGANRADGGFWIVRGGGVPALDVIGYNRRVDWNELLERLQRVIADNVSPVVR
jgi:hypothetical protein